MKGNADRVEQSSTGIQEGFVQMQPQRQCYGHAPTRSADRSAPIPSSQAPLPSSFIDSFFTALCPPTCIRFIMDFRVNQIRKMCLFCCAISIF
jgi:hypothetical protein